MNLFRACLSTLLLWAASSSVVLGEGVSSDPAVIEELSSSIERSMPDRNLYQQVPDEEYLNPYKITVKTSTDCTVASGTVKVTVKDSNTGLPIRRNAVSFLLTNGGKSQYSLDTKTNRNGVATYTFDVETDDINQPLWCSVAVKDSNYPTGYIDVPCSITVRACI